MVNVRVKHYNGGIYHIYNRSVGKIKIFDEETNMNRFLRLIKYYRFKHAKSFSDFLKTSSAVENILDPTPDQTVEVISFTLMPNHFHFELKQLVDGGISYFISNIENSFAKYYNLKNNRTGAVFQANFKSKEINSNAKLLHVSRYIHLNPVTSNLMTFRDLLVYPYNSMMYYKTKDTSFINYRLVLSQFKSFHKYVEFLKQQEDYQKRLHRIKK